MTSVYPKTDIIVCCEEDVKKVKNIAYRLGKTHERGGGEGGWGLSPLLSRNRHLKKITYRKLSFEKAAPSF